jgi:predicted dehydrogenase
MERRRFLTTAGLTAAAYGRVLGANDRIAVGLIGAGGQGRAVWGRMLEQRDVNAAAVCDVFQPHLERAAAMASPAAATYKDFRQLLDRKDIDAVVVATPDHWHAIPTVMACKAGKDVYVEKPLALTVREGRLMLDAARKFNRVVQTGSQQRSGPHYAEAVDVVRGGRLGKVAHVSASHIRNVMPGFGKLPDEPAPSEMDWDMWLGPAPYRPYNPLRGIYHFRWFWDYSGGQMTNFGAHDLDIARWAMDVRAPLKVAAFGGRYALEDGGETPDVQEVIYDFPAFVLTWSVREMNAAAGRGFEFHGTKGNLALSRGGFSLTGETWGPKENRKKMMEDAKREATEQFMAHIRNFLDCVKSRRRPNADVEDGHLSATMCHLGNIATRLGRSLRWDAGREEIVGDREANQWLTKEYRKPWSMDDLKV